VSTAEAIHEQGPITRQAETVEDRLKRFWVIDGGASPAKARQLAWFAGVREGVAGLAANEDWGDDAVARRLLVALLALEQAVQDDDGEDRAWRVREHVTVMADLLSLMLRRLEHQELDDPAAAAAFVAATLSDLSDKEIAALLRVDPKTIANWRTGRVTSIRKNADRVVLVAQLLYELRSSWTPRGLLMWFGSEHPQIGRTPVELMDEDLPRHSETLRTLARAERGQLDA
jgi:hypothetical protein